MIGLALTPNPCLICGKEETIGVAYGEPEEIKFFCYAHFPEEFREPPRPLVEDEWADAMQALEDFHAEQEEKLRGEDNG